MKTKKVLLMGALMLTCALIGAGINYLQMTWVTPEEDLGPAVEKLAVATKEHRQARDFTTAAELLALRRRVTELEQALAERSSEQVPVAVSEEAVQKQPAQETRPQRQSWAQRMEKMKQENPEQYAQMQKRREEFKQRMEEQFRERVDFLSAIDVRNMTEEQRANHEQLAATLARIDELSAKMSEPGAGRSHEVMHEMGEAMGTLSELYRTERVYMFEEMAKSIGYSGSDASAFTEHIQMVIDNTTLMPPIGGRHRNSAPATP